MKHLTGMKDTDIEILNRMDDNTLLKFCSANRETRDFCNDNQQFWLNRIISKYNIPINILNRYKGDRSWSQYYIKDLRYVDNNPIYTMLFGVDDGRLDWVISALHLGVDPNYASPGGSGPELIIRAAIRKQWDVVKYLADHGAEVDKATKFARVNALMFAAFNKGNLDTVKYLVDKGANVNYRSSNNGTPLMMAAESGDMDIVKYLVEKGADPTPHNNQGKTAADIAIDNNHDEIAQYLRSQ